MPEFVQHIKAPISAIANDIVRVECEKTGTVYWKHLRTGECAWTDIWSNPTQLTHTPI